MVQINADFNKKTIIQSDELEWKPSRYPGVCRRYGFRLCKLNAPLGSVVLIFAFPMKVI